MKKVVKMKSFFVLTGLLVCFASFVSAEIYRHVDQYGRVTLTDRPSSDEFIKLIKTWKGWEEARSQIALKDFDKNKKKHATTINYYADRYRLPQSLVHAVVSAESAYDANAISRAGAVGLMQLMPATAKRYGVSNRRNPFANLDGGTRYLRDLLKLFDNDLVLALAAYNAGEGAVKKYGNKVPPYKETRNYVKKVMNYYREYRKL